MTRLVAPLHYRPGEAEPAKHENAGRMMPGASPYFRRRGSGAVRACVLRRSLSERGATWLGCLAWVAAGTGCQMPESVRAVDAWLRAYQAEDVPAMVAHTVEADRPWVKKAMLELSRVPTGTVALSLPPKPMSHEIVEIEAKPSDRRHVVLTKVTLKNPLAYASKRVGQVLKDIPKTRTERRRFLSVREGSRWGVKLDLARVLARTQFAHRFHELLLSRDYTGARTLLSSIPPPPDEANALRLSDRLLEALTKDLEKAEARAQKAADHSKPSSEPGAPRPSGREKDERSPKTGY